MNLNLDIEFHHRYKGDFKYKNFNIMSIYFLHTPPTKKSEKSKDTEKLLEKYLKLELRLLGGILFPISNYNLLGYGRTRNFYFDKKSENYNWNK